MSGRFEASENEMNERDEFRQNVKHLQCSNSEAGQESELKELLDSRIPSM